MAFYIPSPTESLAYATLAAVLVPTVVDWLHITQDLVRFMRKLIQR